LLFCLLPTHAPAQLGSQTVERFIYAIYQNDTNTAWHMLENNTNLIYAREYSSKLPLQEAAAAGNVSLVKRMLELGVEIDTEGDTWNSSGSRMTALDEAAQRGQLEVCKLLLAAGANPNHRAFQDTTLHFAFNNFAFNNFNRSTNREATASILLEYGANPFAEAGYYKTTPLELAITRSDGRLVPLMLDTNRKIKSAPNSRPHPPTRNQAATVKEQAAQFLAAHGTVMLLAAAQRGELEAVEALLKAGVSARTNAPGELPVLQAFAVSEAAAVRNWSSAVAQWQQTSNQIKSFGTNANPQFLASIRVQEAEQATKVESLSPERWRQIRDLLIKNGADYDAFAATALADTNRAVQLLAADKNVVQARDRDGQTPLHWAVLNDQLPFTSFWLQAGASPAATNFAGQTPLHVAATKGLTEHVKLLLAASAPTDIRDTNGWTPLDSAIQAKQSDCIHLLMAKAPVGAHLERGLATPLHETAASGNVAALAALLDTETNLEARNELGLTPLQIAVLHGHLAAAAMLVDKGANVNARDSDGNTLLHQIFLEDIPFVQDLPPARWLERANQDPDKNTFADYLVPSATDTDYDHGWHRNSLPQVLCFLLAAGIDGRAINNDDETALGLLANGKVNRSIFISNGERSLILHLLITHGGNLEQRDADGNTALHRLSSGFYDISKVEGMASLIASGADVNATNNLGQTPLHLASEKIGLWDNNNPPVNAPFQLLIYSKANVNAQDNQGLAPLHVLAQADTSFRTEATRALLDASANPNLRDKQGRTPTHLFLSGKWPWEEAGECIDMLVAAGADLSAKDDQGKTPLHYLAALGSEKPMFFIRGIGDTFTLAKVDINARDNDGDTPLQLAAKTGTQDVYDWLVKQGASQDVTNSAGETPRQQALRSTNVFSEFRLNPDTDLYQAVRDGKLESVAAILKSEPDLLNKTDQLFRQTPLHLAVQTHRTNIVNFLDKQGAQWDPDSAVLAGRMDVLRNLIAQQPGLATDGSLLGLAAANGNVPAAELLLAAGSDLKATDSTGLSPLGNALAQRHSDVADLLLKHGATENIFDAVFANDAETAAALIDKDRSLVSATNSDGVSVGEIAAATDNQKTLKLLLDKGVSPNFKNPDTGKTLLHAAAAYNKTNTAELLIQRRARLDVADDLGLTPVHVAAFRGSTDVLELLLKHKADGNIRVAAPDSDSQYSGGVAISIRDPRVKLEGNTALHLAALTAQTNIIKLLIKYGTFINTANLNGMTALDFAGEFGLPRIGLVNRTGLRLPFTDPYSMRDDPNGRRDAAIALLEQAGAKNGERRGPNGMMFSPPAAAVPARQMAALADGLEYHDQGCTDYNSHNFTNALADFRKSCELGSNVQDYSYYRIWIIRSRLGEKKAATQELTTYLQQRKANGTNDWPFQIGRFLTGQLPEGDFIKAADSSNDQTSHEQHCEAYFYAALKRLIEDDKTAADDYLNKCLATKMENFYEYQSAKVELQFLQVSPTN
jgi:ankyrin repeat protein